MMTLVDVHFKNTTYPISKAFDLFSLLLDALSLRLHILGQSVILWEREKELGQLFFLWRGSTTLEDREIRPIQRSSIYGMAGFTAAAAASVV